MSWSVELRVPVKGRGATLMGSVSESLARNMHMRTLLVVMCSSYSLHKGVLLQSESLITAYLLVSLHTLDTVPRDTAKLLLTAELPVQLSQAAGAASCKHLKTRRIYFYIYSFNLNLKENLSEWKVQRKEPKLTELPFPSYKHLEEY